MSALIAYYNAMTQEKDAATQLASSQARQVDANTGQVAADSEARRNLEGAQAYAAGQQGAQAGKLADSEVGLRGAQTTLTGAQAAYQSAQANAEPALAGSEIALRKSQAALSGAQAAGLPGLQASETALNYGRLGAANAEIARQGSIVDPTRGSLLDQRYGLNNPLYQPPTSSSVSVLNRAEGGMASSGGKGKDPKGTDTIPAMLSPGEAVLNRGATEHLGKGVVDHLNKLGMMRMAAQDEVKAHADAIDGHSVSAAVKAAAKKAKSGAKSAAGR